MSNSAHFAAGAIVTNTEISFKASIRKISLLCVFAISDRLQVGRVEGDLAGNNRIESTDREVRFKRKMQSDWIN